MAEINYEVYSLPAALMVQHKLTEELISDLNKYLDELRADDLRKSAAPDLVGQIHQGEQLSMDPNDTRVAKLIKIVESLGLAYLRHFVQQTKAQLKPKKVNLDQIWSVHSLSGDYNPIHDHITTAPMGISFTTWTQVPEQIGSSETNNNYNLYNNSGAIDGFINFTYGLNQTLDPERLRPSQSRYIKPEPGLLLMFPSWMQHTVYPFFGEGERRTVAGNLNCFDLTKQELEEVNQKEEKTNEQL